MTKYTAHMSGIADNRGKDFKRRGITGQNRDFAPAIVLQCAQMMKTMG